MILKKYFVNITIRVILLAVTCFFLAEALHRLNEGLYYTAAGLIMLIILQVALMVRFLNRINRDLAMFFNAVKSRDASLVFPETTRNRSYDALLRHMNDTSLAIRQIQTGSEKKSLYLENIIDQVDSALLSYNDQEEIELFNRAASSITGLSNPRWLADLEMRNKAFVRLLRSIRPGETRIFRTVFRDRSFYLSVKAKAYKTEDEAIRLISFQNITPELELKELESWQKLIRILNHEIMNSLSPVTSLTKTITGYFRRKDSTLVSPEEIDGKILKKTVNGLTTIGETGSGLIRFIDNYRSITSLPRPEFKEFQVQELFADTVTLTENQFGRENFIIHTAIYPGNLQLLADFGQIRQVLLNLVYNAIEAMKNTTDPTVSLMALRNSEGHIVIEITDNGQGIPREILEDIFVPFFTTRENGSGVGLSLARQIMRLHNGTIIVHSHPGETVFTLTF